MATRANARDSLGMENSISNYSNPVNCVSSKSKGLILHFQNKNSGVKKLTIESRGSY